MSTDEPDTTDEPENEIADEQPGITDTVNTDDPEPEYGDLSDLQERRTWEFDVEAPNGKLVHVEGSDPESDEGVAQITAPTGNATLLYRRIIRHLNDSPEINDENWDDINPAFRSEIASKHGDEFGLERYMTDSQVESIMQGLSDEANADAPQDE